MFIKTSLHCEAVSFRAGTLPSRRKGEHCWQKEFAYSMSRINQDIPKRKTVPGPDIHYHANTLHSSYHTIAKWNQHISASLKTENDRPKINATTPFKSTSTRQKTNYFFVCFGGRCPFYLRKDTKRKSTKKSKLKIKRGRERIEREPWFSCSAQGYLIKQKYDLPHWQLLLIKLENDKWLN